MYNDETNPGMNNTENAEGSALPKNEEQNAEPARPASENTEKTEAPGFTSGGFTPNPYAQSTAGSWSGSEYSFTPPEKKPYNPGAGTAYGTGAQGTIGNTAPLYSGAQYTRPKKNRKNGMSKGGVAALVVVCVLLSGAAGFGGAYAANRFFGGSGGSSVIYQSTVSTDNMGETTYSVANVAEAVSDSVVEIVTEQVTTNSIFGQYVSKGAGSGVIISADGYIITCAHVIDGATTVTVTLANGETYDAKVIGSDSQTDIALLKVEADGLTVAVVGNSDKLVVGEPAIAIGNPLGELGGTTTSGIISALEREVTIDGTTYSLLQTNAAINPGNSGGALFNINGELIGIVNAKESGNAIEGLGFAIPINGAMDVVEQLRTNGYVTGRPAFGLYLYDVSDDTALYDLRNSDYSSLINYVKNYGVYFLKYNDSQTGDLKFGDRLVAIDGTSISDLSDVKSVLANYKIGDTATITISRITDTQSGRATIVDVPITLVESVTGSVTK